MGIVYRHKKQEPLTIEEMDGNFANLDERIKKLEDNPSLGEGIAHIDQEGDQLTIYGTYGSLLGKAILPKVFPNYCGKWQLQTFYRVLDSIQYEKAVYSCIQAHTSQNFKEDKNFWALVFEI